MSSHVQMFVLLRFVFQTQGTHSDAVLSSFSRFRVDSSKPPDSQDCATLPRSDSHGPIGSFLGCSELKSKCDHRDRWYAMPLRQLSGLLDLSSAGLRLSPSGPPEAPASIEPSLPPRASFAVTTNCCIFETCRKPAVSKRRHRPLANLLIRPHFGRHPG